AGRLARTEPEGDPDQQGNAQEVDRQMVVLRQRQPAEDRQPHADQGDEQERRLEEAWPADPQARVVLPEDQQRGDQDGARGVAEPPGQPDRPVVGPGSEPSQGEARDPAGGAGDGARDAGEPDKPEDVERTAEAAGAAGAA